MPKGVSKRASSSYPSEYMKVFQHVINTEQQFEVHNLKNRGQCVAMRQSMFRWRKQLENEGSPLASMLYSCTVSIFGRNNEAETPIEINDWTKMGRSDLAHWYLVVRLKDKTFSEALKGINIPESQKINHETADEPILVSSDAIFTYPQRAGSGNNMSTTLQKLMEGDDNDDGPGREADTSEGGSS